MNLIFLGVDPDEGVDQIQRAVDALHLGVSQVTVIAGLRIKTPAKEWAQKRSIPVNEFVANWRKHGQCARPRRNQAAAVQADGVVVLSEQLSHDERHILAVAMFAKIHIHHYP